ncbi:MAG: hypothetical protein JHC87_10010, partial [Thermoleophilaceae bacterium]|nr:hypothetical protein [Thermoleophilaceae bacterium]
MSRMLIANSTNTARSSVMVAATSLVAAALGAVFAVLVTVVLGKGPSTDGFLAAYSAYTLFILFGTTLRTALIPQFGPANQPERFVA